MTQIVPFNFESTTLRVVTGDNGEPLFVGKDLCEALGYANHNDAIKQHCRGVAKRYPIVDSLGRTQEARVLTEADMFRLIVNSNLPAAERFEDQSLSRWTSEMSGRKFFAALKTRIKSSIERLASARITRTFLFSRVACPCKTSRSRASWSVIPARSTSFCTAWRAGLLNFSPLS